MGHEWAAGTALGARWVKRVPSCTTMFYPTRSSNEKDLRAGGGGENLGDGTRNQVSWPLQTCHCLSPGLPEADKSAGGRARPNLGDSSPPHPWGSQPPGQAMLVYTLASWLQVPFLTFLRQGRSTSWFSILKKSVLHQLMYGLSK